MNAALRRIGALAAVVALTVAFSCKTFSLTDEICDPSRIDAMRNEGEPSDGPCSRCLENNCCDKVGVCGNKEGCAAIVKNVHACVLASNKTGKGAEDEQACASANHLAENPEANEAYRCMRDECGPSCALPVCRVDPATVLFTNAACDRCFSGACCPELRGCYGSRACKLTVECIAKCRIEAPPPDAGVGGPDAGANGFVTKESDLCEADGRVKPVRFGPPACVSKCLCRFKDNDQGLAPLDESLRSFNLAIAVYECGAAHACIQQCARGPDDPDEAADGGP